MIILNKDKSVNISIVESTEYLNSNYLIYKVYETGCVGSDPIQVGQVDNLSFDVNLEDGEYVIKISPNSTVSELEQNFIVFYNSLPNIIQDIKDIFCSENCGDCLPTDKEQLYKIFYKTFLFLFCSGLLNRLPVTKKYACEQNKILKEKCEYFSYYGKFIFSYEDSIKKFFAYLYAELYNHQINNINNSEDYLNQVNSIFKIDVIEKCLYNSNISLEDFMCDIKNLNCNCNG